MVRSSSPASPTDDRPVAPSAATAGNPWQFTGWLVSERLLRSIITATVLALVARHLTPSGFGLLNLALAVVGTAMPLAQLGLDNVLVRELVRQPEAAGTLLGGAAGLRALIGAGTAAVVQLVALWPAFAPARGPIAVISLLLLLQSLEVTDLWFRRHVQSRAVALARLGTLLLGAGGKLALVAAGSGVLAFAAVQVAESALYVGALAWAYARGRPTGPAWRWDPATARFLWRECRGFAVAALIGSIALRIDQFAVSAWLGTEAAGQYFAALRLIEFPLFIATTLSVGLFPQLAATADAAALTRSFTLMSALGWITALGATAAGPWFVPFFFGRDYTPATAVLVLQAWACLPLFTGLVRAQFLAVQAAAGTQLGTAVFTLLAQIGLCALLLPTLGLMGGALAFLLTQLASAWLLPWVLPALRPCLRWQARALVAAWRPSFWSRLHPLERNSA